MAPYLTTGLPLGNGSLPRLSIGFPAETQPKGFRLLLGLNSIGFSRFISVKSTSCRGVIAPLDQAKAPQKMTLPLGNNRTSGL